MYWVDNHIGLYKKPYVLRIDTVSKSVQHKIIPLISNNWELANCQVIAPNKIEFLTINIEDYNSSTTLEFQIWNSDLHKQGLQSVIPYISYKCAKLAQDGRLVVIGSLYHALIIDMYKKSMIDVLADQVEWVWAIDVAIVQRQLITGGNEKVLRFWNVDSGALLDEAKYPIDEFIKGIVIDRRSRWYTTWGFQAKEIIIWDFGKRQEVHRMNAVLTEYNSIQYSADSDLIAVSSSDGTLTVLETENFSTIFVEKNINWIAIPSMVFSSDKKRLALYCLFNNILQIINLETKQIETTINL